MKFWWLTDTVRLGSEQAAVETLAQAEGWFQLDRWRFHEGKLCAEGVISAHGQAYPVRLVYPDQFPDVPAWVEPQDETRWTTHQYGAGTLCLELRPDNWVVTATGADVLRSAHNLLIIENPLGEGSERAPSAHHIGELQAYGWGANPVLIGAGCRDRIRRGEAADLRALRWMAADDVWPILVHDAEDRSGPLRPPGPDLNSWRFEVTVFVSSRTGPTGSADRAALVEAGGFAPEVAGAVEASSAGLLLFAGEDELVASHLLADGAAHRRSVFVLPEQSGARSGRAPEAEAKRVAIVGAGSVGSKIAESLVRSGVSRFNLVDGDVLLPGNLERHVLEWRDVGFRKVHGLKRRLLGIAPGAEVEVVDVNLNWQRSARTHAWQIASVAGCDVIVDATGDPATALFLGAVADANHRAFISVEVFEGGIGGLIAACLPGRDPPFTLGRAAFLGWCDEQGVKPPEPGPRRYEALAEDGSPLVADDAAVTMTAGHAARVVLDILDGNPPPISSAWLLLGYRQGWLFDGHGHTIRLSVGERAAAGPTPEDPEAKAFVMDLVKEYLGAGKAGS
ncbi:ThiF family adenylyltransferase [Sphingosinicella rhizophila]|uniref:ThiF family adenylyltransferase n=1 Tax=Sphingosinicella rhizophila TaxID=3050082 RepID=A0ABU3QAM8_9SPHN|nr:ThiF family adenylyltransferase [Sphingosinicella sp. GR2756]MDT9600434.1 ThiF family adenylyltransferase [Sphingosinicella sp. GR2756]